MTNIYIFQVIPIKLFINVIPLQSDAIFTVTTKQNIYEIMSVLISPTEVMVVVMSVQCSWSQVSTCLAVNDLSTSYVLAMQIGSYLNCYYCRLCMAMRIVSWSKCTVTYGSPGCYYWYDISFGISPVFHYKIVVNHGVSESTDSLMGNWSEILHKQFLS